MRDADAELDRAVIELQFTAKWRGLRPWHDKGLVARFIQIEG
jgi:hypothetical protein